MTNRSSQAHNTQSAPVKIGRNAQSLRNQLFISSALLTTILLVAAAWVISHQVVGQARQQVQAEVETLLPLYDVVWNERARRLATIGTTLADSPIVKTVFGDERASRDQQTLHEMIADAGSETISPGDLVLVSDGGGQIFFAEKKDGTASVNAELPTYLPGDLHAARTAGESQTQQQSFTMLGERLFQLVLTPVVLHSASAETNNTLAVIGTGSELNREVAGEVKQRINSEVVFLIRDSAGEKLYASSFAPDKEQVAVQAIAAAGIATAPSANPQAAKSVEIKIGEEVFLAFVRPLADFDGKPIGYVVVLRSLAVAGQMFRAISNQLLLLWSLAIAVAWLLSYLIAGRITRPLESLATNVQQFGQQFGRTSGQGDDEVAAPAKVQGEVAQLSQSFDQMRQSIKQSQAALLKNERLATIGQMASSIIHDLRNPLATISTAAEVMKSDNLQTDRRRTMIETQLRAAHRMNAMLTEILEFSRGSYRLNPRRQPLASIVERATQELGAQMAQLGVELRVNIPPEIMVEADEEKLARVFENLLANSIQAVQQNAAHGGAIEIRAANDGSGARVELIDNGPGVPLAIRERLFEPFISHGKQGGTGLGLAIARGVVEAHGGRIRLENSRGSGAHFVIRLPQVVSDADAGAGGEHGTQSFAG